MEEDEFLAAMNEIRRRVEKAVASSGMGVKPFAKNNGMGETVVRDLIKAHNKDVQLSTLRKIAKGAKVPLTSLLPGQVAPVTQQALAEAIADAWPARPADEAMQPEYLAEAVLNVLRLPSGLRRAPGNDQSPEQGGSTLGDPRA